MPVQSHQKIKTENTDKSKCWGKYGAMATVIHCWQKYKLT